MLCCLTGTATVTDSFILRRLHCAECALLAPNCNASGLFLMFHAVSLLLLYTFTPRACAATTLSVCARPRLEAQITHCCLTLCFCRSLLTLLALACSPLYAAATFQTIWSGSCLPAGNRLAPRHVLQCMERLSPPVCVCKASHRGTLESLLLHAQHVLLGPMHGFPGTAHKQARKQLPFFWVLASAGAAVRATRRGGTGGASMQASWLNAT